MKLVTFNSTRELLGQAVGWNDLWQRSDCTWPTMRAEPLAQWIDTFAAHGRVRILAVERNGSLLAALPFVEDHLGFLKVGKLPGSDLCSVGDLLVDHEWSKSSGAILFDVLVDGIARLPWPLVRFDAIFPETPRWRGLLEAFEKRQVHYVARHRGSTGVIDVRDTWDAYFADRSRNHRRHMRVVRNRAEREGTLDLQLLANPSCDQIERLLRRGFEVEDRSWKGEEGSSTLRSPEAFRYFLDQAKLLSTSGHLLLTFLELNGHAIGFEYGWLSKGVYHSLKVGYDEAYARLSPGQLLRYLMMERLFAEGEIMLVDYLGPLSDATNKWATRTYPVSRVVVANGVIGRALLWGYSKKIARHRATALPRESNQNTLDVMDTSAQSASPNASGQQATA